MINRKSLRIRNRVLIVILVPIAVILWLIGWSLFNTASQLHKSKKAQTIAGIVKLSMEAILPEELVQREH